jgi:hypothetical protein
MKAFLFLLLFLLAVSQSGFKSPAAKNAPLEGAWRLVSAEWQNVPAEWPYGNTYDSKTSSIKVIKMFTKSHVSFSFYDQQNKKFILAGGGTYSLNGDKYLEKLEYWSLNNSAGYLEPMEFSYQVKGNRFYQKGAAGEKLVVDEVYERVD